MATVNQPYKCSLLSLVIFIIGGAIHINRPPNIQHAVPTTRAQVRKSACADTVWVGEKEAVTRKRRRLERIRAQGGKQEIATASRLEQRLERKDTKLLPDSFMGRVIKHAGKRKDKDRNRRFSGCRKAQYVASWKYSKLFFNAAFYSSDWVCARCTLTYTATIHRLHGAVPRDLLQQFLLFRFHETTPCTRESRYIQCAGAATLLQQDAVHWVLIRCFC